MENTRNEIKFNDISNTIKSVEYISEDTNNKDINAIKLNDTYVYQKKYKYIYTVIEEKIVETNGLQSDPIISTTQTEEDIFYGNTFNKTLQLHASLLKGSDLQIEVTEKLKVDIHINDGYVYDSYEYSLGLEDLGDNTSIAVDKEIQETVLGNINIFRYIYAREIFK